MGVAISPWVWLSLTQPCPPLSSSTQKAEPSSIAQKVVIAGREDNAFAFPSPAPRGRLWVRVRAGDTRSDRWSDWSPALELGDNTGVTPTSCLMI